MAGHVANPATKFEDATTIRSLANSEGMTQNKHQWKSGDGEYIGWSDVTECTVSIRSPFCGCKTIFCVEFNGKDKALSCYSNETEPFILRKFSHDHWRTNKDGKMAQKSAGVDMEQNCVTVTLCTVYTNSLRMDHTFDSGAALSFYRAMLCIRGTSHGPVSVCVCLCLSQSGVLLKRQNVGSHKQHHTIPQGL